MQMIQGSLFDSMHADAQESFVRPSSADSWSEDASWTEGEKKQALHPQLKEALQAILDMDIEQMRASEALFELDHLQQILQVCEGEIV